jgi:hypothetical protein
MEVTVCIIALVILFSQVHLFKIKTDSDHNSRYFQLYRLVYDCQNLAMGQKTQNADSEKPNLSAFFHGPLFQYISVIQYIVQWGCLSWLYSHMCVCKLAWIMNYSILNVFAQQFLYKNISKYFYSFKIKRQNFDRAFQKKDKYYFFISL